MIDINILNDIKTEHYQSKKKDNNEKKIDNEKITNVNISNVKFANMTNLKSFKYASMFINKTFNNFL
jgi:hypothetical protein